MSDFDLKLPTTVGAAAATLVERGVSATPGSTLKGWLVGPPGQQRVRASQSLLVLLVYVVFAAVQHAEVMLGLIDRTPSLWLTLIYLGGAVAFYMAIRSGLNEHVRDDPSLTVAQISFGFVIAAGSYAITGPARGAVMTLMVVGMVYGTFALTEKQSRRLALFAFTILGVTMIFKALTDPARYPPVVEAVHLVFAAIVMAAVSVLAQRMGALRRRLSAQKKELEAALVQIRILATQDELTGLVNRRHMTELLSVEHARVRRDAAPMMLGLLDIDWFKCINDQHGHGAGDAVLRIFAATVRSSLRSTDVLARWGGEEFLLMMPGTEQAQATRCIERVREGLKHTSLDHIAPGLRVTFSAGLCACGASDSVEATIERADQALYLAKGEGRDRTVAA